MHINEHHTIEDNRLALGQAVRQALGDKRGTGRYGSDPPQLPWQVSGAAAHGGFTLPMDETQASAVLDFSGRPYFVFEGTFVRERVGDMPTELVPHFLRSPVRCLRDELALERAWRQRPSRRSRGVLQGAGRVPCVRRYNATATCFLLPRGRYDRGCFD